MYQSLTAGELSNKVALRERSCEQPAARGQRVGAFPDPSEFTHAGVFCMKPSSSSPRNPGRRQVLQGFAGAAALAGLGAGGSAWAQAGKEAPALAKMVADGKLPPLAQRVGSNPLVVKADKVGTYGGALRRGLRGSADHNGILRV